MSKHSLNRDLVRKIGLILIITILNLLLLSVLILVIQTRYSPRETEKVNAWEDWVLESPRLAKIVAHWEKSPPLKLNNAQQKRIKWLHKAVMEDYRYAMLSRAIYQDNEPRFVSVEKGFMVHNRWYLDAEPGSVFMEYFPKGARMMLNGERVDIPLCEEGMVPILLKGELYPLKSTPKGVDVENVGGEWLVLISGDVDYQHRAIVDIGCAPPE
ncbi:hypothetical protein [uncultured Shewanella sp.]|uniref:hypothetical protein n=1 Tax=uncultured Shewanella sp. TaxID=173975 RepID=UPI002619CF0F|nr:hypothetical protein [uncultured Shewanella sp.]